MKNLRTNLIVLLALFSQLLFSQNNRARSILATAVIETDPPSVVISWPQERVGDVFILKNKTEPFFQLPSGTNSFTDSDVEVGGSYEYDIYVQDASNAGYIKVAIEEEMQDINGRLLLVIDDQFKTSLAFEISRLEADIESEGWVVDKIYVGRDWSPPEVKAKILNENAQAPLSSVLLFGHVPIPLSGRYASDGHPDHVGAWPADTYYGDLDGEWTDRSAVATNATRPTNYNVPGDGRFDQSTIPSDIELEVGRVDLWNMPDFGLEEDLLRNYLDKNHAFRTRQITSIERALIDDNFPSFDIAPWSWRSFSSMFGEENIVSNSTPPSTDYFTELSNNNYLWSFGTGPGSFTSCGGVVNSAQYAQNSLNTIFTSLSGSYFGDFNSTNNLLRAPLASSSPTLVNFWGGIPTWAIHEMATGKHIGHCAKLSQNNNINNVGGYAGNFNGSQRRVHIALMGDPTLRMHTTIMPSNLQTSKFNSNVDLTWDAASHTGTLGYHIYRMDPLEKTTIRVTDDYITETSYTDILEDDIKTDKLVYFVRAVSLKLTPSGSYYNLSSGTCDTLVIGSIGSFPNLSLNSLEIAPEPSCSGVDMQISFSMCGAELLTSFDIEYSVDNAPVQTLSWQGELENGGTELYDLIDVDISPGPHTIVITLTNPNGTQDLSVNNNTLTKDFDVIKGNEVTIKLTTDQKGWETHFAWNTTALPNFPILTAGGFANNTDYELPFCLENGCYIIQVRDFGNDGICCNSGEGSYQVLLGETLITEGADFGSLERYEFCVPIECDGFDFEAIIINSDIDPTVDVSQRSLSYCAGSEVSVTASGGDTYLWENGATTATTTLVLDSFYNEYAVTVTNADGCTVVDHAGFTGLDIEPVDAGEDISVCPGTEVTLTATAGPGSFFWGDVGGANFIVTPTQTTEYEVRHVSTLGCEFTDVVVVTVEDFEIETEFIIPSCNGLSDASATVIPINGTPPFTYQWNIGATSAEITNVIAGPYSVVVTDLYNCSAELNFEITQPDPISVVIEASNETIAGASDGVAVANVIGGTAPYTYAWSNNETTQTISGLAVGTYSVTVMDVMGCEEVMSVAIDSGDIPCNNISVSLSGSDLSCFDSNDGSILPTVENAIGAVSFAWSNGFAGSELENLSIGTYGLTVSDENNCTAEAFIEISAPEELLVDISIPEVTCSGGQGSAIASVSGGTSPYTYNWSNGSSSAINAGLDGGSYTLTLTDSNGCEVISEIDIEVSNEIIVEFNIGDLDCFGDENGSIEAIVTGGVGTYTYAWSNGANDFSIEDLPSGEFTVTITDSNNCSVEANLMVETPEELLVDFEVVGISCADENDGRLTAMVNGGTEPYIYAWSNGGDGVQITDLESGDYELTIIDANNCVQTQSMNLSNPQPLVVNGTSSNETVEGASDGTAEVEILGGTPPYEILWSNGGTTPLLENLSPGEYTFNVIDANDCTDALTILISSGSDPCDDFAISLTSNNVTCFGGSDGMATVQVENATGQVFINWNTGALGMESIEALEAGIYTVTISDQNNCNQEASIEIFDGDQIEIDFESTDVLCNGDENGTIQTIISGGTAPYDFIWSNGESEEDLEGLAVGEYGLEVSDANGCSASGVTFISTPFAIDASVTTNNESIQGAADGSAILSLSGGTGNVEILWLDLATNFQVATNILSVDNLSPGDYIILLTDENDCRATVAFTIGSGSDPCEDFNASISLEEQIKCFGDSDASILIQVDNANGNYSVSLNGNSLSENIETIEGLDAGNYEINIVDEQGCSIDLTVEIDEPMELTGAISGSDISCFGANDGSTSVAVVGGTGAYNYIWSNGATTSDLENLPPGSYEVIVADENDCTLEFNFEIEQPSEILVTTASSPVICEIAGAITLSATGGTNEFEYVWEEGSISSFPLEVTSAGTYEINVIDGDCIEVVEVIVEEDSYIIATLEIDDFTICYGENLAVTIPETKHSIEWSTGDTTYTLNILEAGDYAYTLTDDFGCTGSSSFSVFETEALLIALSTTNADDGNNGTASASVNGGNTMVTYEWSTGETTMEIDGLAPGTYSLTITDEFGCQESQTFEIEDFNTSIISVPELNSFEVYPNPTTDVINIVLDFETETKFELSIIDILGTSLIKRNDLQSQKVHTIPLSQLPAGSYFVNIKTSRGIVTKKILVTK